ncbi:MAG: hypothetical protein JNM18_08150 [Planctomycetaceae bacterium]|nr:hypothetical protein [Planctomycetaceae bacterium]
MAAPLDEIRLLYRQQQYLDCLLRFHQLIESLGPDPNSADIAQLTPLWCDLFHGRQCLLMKAVRLADRSKRVEDLLQAITGLFGGLRGQQFAPAVEQLDPAPEFLLARLDILTVLLDPPAVNVQPVLSSRSSGFQASSVAVPRNPLPGFHAVEPAIAESAIECLVDVWRPEKDHQRGGPFARSRPI